MRPAGVIPVLPLRVYSWMLLSDAGRWCSNVSSQSQTHVQPVSTFTTIMNQVCAHLLSYLCTCTDGQFLVSEMCCMLQLMNTFIPTKQHKKRTAQKQQYTAQPTYTSSDTPNQ